MITIIPLPHNSDKWLINKLYIPRDLESLVNFVAKLTIGHVAPFRQNEVVVNIHAASPKYIRFLNRRYRNKDKPTNVLSFPADALPDDIEDMCRELGDVFICMEVIQKEAEELQKPLREHLSRMIVHGILHLMGYDHENDADEARMLQKEGLILAKMGINLD